MSLNNDRIIDAFRSRSSRTSPLRQFSVDQGRIGKSTSLAALVRWGASNERFVVSVAQAPFFDSVSTQDVSLPKIIDDFIYSAWRQWQALDSTVPFEIDSFIAMIPDLREQIGLQSLEGVVRAIHLQARSRFKRSLLLIVDEAQSFVWSQDVRVVQSYRGLLSQQEFEAQFVHVTVPETRSGFLSLLARAHEGINVNEFRYLVQNVDSVREYVRRITEGSRIEFTEEAVAALVEASRGVPAIINGLLRRLSPRRLRVTREEIFSAVVGLGPVHVRGAEGASSFFEEAMAPSLITPRVGEPVRRSWVDVALSRRMVSSRDAFVELVDHLTDQYSKPHQGRGAQLVQVSSIDEQKIVMQGVLRNLRKRRGLSEIREPGSPSPHIHFDFTRAEAAIETPSLQIAELFRRSIDAIGLPAWQTTPHLAAIVNSGDYISAFAAIREYSEAMGRPTVITVMGLQEGLKNEAFRPLAEAFVAQESVPAVVLYMRSANEDFRAIQSDLQRMSRFSPSVQVWEPVPSAEIIRQYISEITAETSVVFSDDATQALGDLSLGSPDSIRMMLMYLDPSLEAVGRRHIEDAYRRMTGGDP